MPDSLLDLAVASGFVVSMLVTFIIDPFIPWSFVIVVVLFSLPLVLHCRWAKWMLRSENLQTAARIGHLNDVRHFLEKDNVAVDERDARGVPALVYAVRNGSVAVARLLLEAGASVNIRTTDGTTPLFECCNSSDDRRELIGLLLDFEADVDKTCMEYGLDYTPLMVAARGYDAEVVLPRMELLIWHGADVDFESPVGLTALAVSAAAGPAEAVQLLLEYGADPEVGFYNPLQEAVGHFDSARRVLEMLLDAGGASRINEYDLYRMTVLFTTIETGHVTSNVDLDVLELLLERGADVNWRIGQDRTALHHAVLTGRTLMLPVIGMLLEAGVDPSASDVRGETALHLLSARLNHWPNAQDHEAAEAAEMMLEKEADAEAARDEDGFTPFLLAASQSEELVPETMERMLQHKLDKMPEYD